MTKIEDSPALVERLASLVEGTSVAEPERARVRAGWQQIIDGDLAEWSKNPEQFEDDGYKAPSLETIALAARIASACRDAGWPAPSRVVPDGEGGIAFNRHDGSLFEITEIRANGEVEQLVFRDSKLIQRRRII